MTSHPSRKVFLLLGALYLVVGFSLGQTSIPSSCGTDTTSQAGSGTSSSNSGGSSGSSLTLTSDDITSGGTIASTFAMTDCMGGNQSPHLAWSGTLPSGTLSLAVTVIDTSFNNAVHWLLYNIPTTSTTLSRNSSPSEISNTTREVQNVYGDIDYGGPCPPTGESHTYQFTVWALDVADLMNVSGFNANSGSSAYSLLQEHDLASASFNATFVGP